MVAGEPPEGSYGQAAAALLRCCADGAPYPHPTRRQLTRAAVPEPNKAHRVQVQGAGCSLSSFTSHRIDAPSASALGLSGRSALGGASCRTGHSQWMTAPDIQLILFALLSGAKFSTDAPHGRKAQNADMNS